MFHANIDKKVDELDNNKKMFAFAFPLLNQNWTEQAE